jgi:hypothetical protein
MKMALEMGQKETEKSSDKTTTSLHGKLAHFIKLQ